MVWPNDTSSLAITVTVAQGTMDAEPSVLFGPPSASSNQRPVVTIESPSVGSMLARTAALTFTIIDPDGSAIVLQRILIRTGGSSGVWEQAYADGAACQGYAVTRTVITDGYRYSVTRTAGWLAGGVEMEPLFADTLGAAGINL